MVHHPIGVSYFVGSEVRVDRPESRGLKAGAYVTGGFAMGAQTIRYVQGSKGMTVLRPEIGIGFFKFKKTYAYHVSLTKPRMEGVNTHLMAVSYGFRLKRLRVDEDWEGGME